MKRTLSLFLLLTAFPAFTLISQSAPPTPNPLTVAVFDFEATGDNDKAVGVNAANLLAVSLGTHPAFLVIDRAEIDKILGEQELGLSGAVQTETAAKVGQLAGAQLLVTGRVFRAGDTNYLIVKLISSETGRVFAEKASFDQLTKLEGAVDALGAKLAEVVEKKAPELTAKVETEEEFQKRLRGLLGNRKPGPISISVAEQHIGRPVIDPAVETEIARQWIALGGTVVKPGTEGAKAEVTGEAFSEFGLRRGNLSACRARAEITVKRDKVIVSQDREVASAVDLGEHIAGKAALEKTARLWLAKHVTDLAAE